MWREKKTRDSVRRREISFWRLATFSFLCLSLLRVFRRKTLVSPNVSLRYKNPKSKTLLETATPPGRKIEGRRARRTSATIGTHWLGTWPRNPSSSSASASVWFRSSVIVFSSPPRDRFCAGTQSRCLKIGSGQSRALFSRQTMTTSMPTTTTLPWRLLYTQASSLPRVAPSDSF